MEIKYGNKFKKQYKKLDKSIRIKVNKAILRLAKEYKSKKYLRNVFKGNQTIRVKPYRIIFEIKDDIIKIRFFDHRKRIYK